MILWDGYKHPQDDIATTGCHGESYIRAKEDRLIEYLWMAENHKFIDMVHKL
jgi:hypothetical protein